jgi:hypothetical protein
MAHVVAIRVLAPVIVAFKAALGFDVSKSL